MSGQERERAHADIGNSRKGFETLLHSVNTRASRALSSVSSIVWKSFTIDSSHSPKLVVEEEI
jgi:hypothetical protein